jgi:hypothetical protein
MKGKFPVLTLLHAIIKGLLTRVETGGKMRVSPPRVVGNHHIQCHQHSPMVPKSHERYIPSYYIFIK